MIATYSNSLIKQDGTEWLANTIKHTIFMQMSINSFNLLQNVITGNLGFYSLDPEFQTRNQRIHIQLPHLKLHHITKAIFLIMVW